MADTKHTPGPYGVVKYGNNKWEVQGPIVPIKSNWDKPVTTLTGRIAIFDRKADADFFAAAPEQQAKIDHLEAENEKLKAYMQVTLQHTHTPKQDREYIEYARAIQINVVRRLVSITDRLEAEKAELIEILKRLDAWVRSRPTELAFMGGSGIIEDIQAALSKHTPVSEQGGEQTNPKQESE